MKVSHQDPPAHFARGQAAVLCCEIKNDKIMANFNQVVIGQAADYTVSRIEKPDDKSYAMLYVRNSSGFEEFNRLFIGEQDISNYQVGDTIKLVPWTMKIIPVKRKNANGEERTLRVLSGLSFNEAQAEAAAIRSMQSVYDSATHIARSEESIRLAKKDLLFADFVERNEFIKTYILDEE